MHLDMTQLVDADCGLISRRIFIEPEIYERELTQDFYVGARRDILRRVDGAWKIAHRKLTLDQNVLLAKNVSIFF